MLLSECFTKVTDISLLLFIGSGYSHNCRSTPAFNNTWRPVKIRGWMWEWVFQNNVFLISTFSHISGVWGAVVRNAGPRWDWVFFKSECVSASDSSKCCDSRSAARLSVWTAKAQTLYSSNQQNQVCFPHRVFLHVLFSNLMFLLSLALSFSMNHGGLFDVCLEEVVWKVYCGKTWKEAKLHLISLTRFLNGTGWKKEKRTSQWSMAINLGWNIL